MSHAFDRFGIVGAQIERVRAVLDRSRDPLLDLANSARALAAGVMTGVRIQDLLAIDPPDVVRLGLTALSDSYGASTTQRELERLNSHWREAFESSAIANATHEFQRQAELLVKPFEQLRRIGAAFEDEGIRSAFLTTEIDSLFGNWRNVSRSFLDTVTGIDARVALYADLGMDPGLAKIPRLVFSDVLTNTGLRFDLLDRPTGRVRGPTRRRLASGSGARSSEGLVPTRECRAVYEYLWALESALRRHVRTVLRQLYGESWLRDGVPREVREEWERRGAAKGVALGDDLLIDYSDLGHLLSLVERRTHWKHFEPALNDLEDFRVSIKRIMPMRNDVMHCRPLAKEDALLAFVECRRVLVALRVPVRLVPPRKH